MPFIFLLLLTRIGGRHQPAYARKPSCAAVILHTLCA